MENVGEHVYTPEEWRDPYERLEALESAVQNLRGHLEHVTRYSSHAMRVLEQHQREMAYLTERLERLEFRIRQWERKQEMLP